MALMRYTRLGECEQCAHCTRRRAEERSIARAFPAGPRWIGDGHSWVVPLDIAGVSCPPLPGVLSDASPLARDPSFVTTWEMVDRRPRHGETGKKIRARAISGDGFLYAYVINDDKLKRAMAAVQHLYVHIPRGWGGRGSPANEH